VTSDTGEAPVLVTRNGRVGIVTLHRPHRRNAINAALLDALVTAVETLDADPGCGAIVLTGTDPAFCAGLDLAALAAGERFGVASDGLRGPLGPRRTPLVGAINGPAVTGGLELALACDLLIASDRATFADTHARVGVMPGWGMSVLLPAAIGARRAAEMTLSGNYVDAPTAAAWGLVNRVVPHERLLDDAVGLAGDIASSDPEVIGELLTLLHTTTSLAPDAAWDAEAAASRRWWRERLDPAAIDRRRHAVIERGRRQQG
jgi:enoyl-CoA hydratase